MLDFELAAIYGNATKDFNRQVKNNIDKFDADFMFELTREEWAGLRCKNFTSSWGRSKYLAKRRKRYTTVEHRRKMVATA